MCNRYVAPAEGDIERAWLTARRQTPHWASAVVAPRKPGPFIRASKTLELGRELVVGQWGLVPWFAKSPKLTYSTNNARAEELAQKASFKHPWARGQRCIIPALSFDEPNWESGRNVWWRFQRADGQLWGLAGLWAAWTDKATGEIHESYTMLTLNADAHPLMKRMHKPEPDLPADAQDKRSVVPVQAADVDQWLHGTAQEAQALIKLAPAEEFDAGPMQGS
jgi:putative SOS response-associated peptidase YedK